MSFEITAEKNAFSSFLVRSLFSLATNNTSNFRDIIYLSFVILSGMLIQLNCRFSKIPVTVPYN